MPIIPFIKLCTRYSNEINPFPKSRVVDELIEKVRVPNYSAFDAANCDSDPMAQMNFQTRKILFQLLSTTKLLENISHMLILSRMILL